MTGHESTGRLGRSDVGDASLRALLRAADPGRDLPPAARRTVDAQVSAAVARDRRDRRAEAAAAAARGRRTRLLVGLAGAAAVAWVVTAVALGPGPSGSADSAGSAAASAAEALGAPAASCAPVTAEALAEHELAYRARVAQVDGGDVVLEVERRYRGEVEDRVVLPQPPGAAADELHPKGFEEGEEYLVTSDDGRLSVCGQTGPASPELQALYKEPFPD